jgi:hypothetical protein
VRPYRLPGQPRAPLAGVVAAPAALESPPPLPNARRGSPHRGSSSLGRDVHGRRLWGRGIAAPLPREGCRERTCRRPSKQRRSLRHHREDAEIGGVKRIRLSGGIEERERAAFVRREPPPPPGCCGAGARLGAAARARAGGRDLRGRERVVDRDGRGFGIRWAPQGRWWWPGGACGCNLFLRDRQLL